MSDRRKILVTSALPYANGSIHLGYILEAVQTDIWARFQRLRGHECYYVCADDAHGNAIMLKAEQLGLTSEQHIANIQVEHERDLADFLIQFDNYHSTHSEENRELSSLIYTRLRDNGHIAKREIKQAFDPEKGIFLADRYIKGTCPKCKTPDQYGDNCEACGATYIPTELINPVSAISGATPIEKESTHYFFKLPEFEQFLKDWTRAGHLQEEVANKLGEWLESGLQEWDISRDAPTSVLKFPMRRANTSTYGWTPPSAIWPVLKCYASGKAWTLTNSGAKTPTPSCTILSARILSTSTPCSGRPCSPAPTSAPPPR